MIVAFLFYSLQVDIGSTTLLHVTKVHFGSRSNQYLLDRLDIYSLPSKQHDGSVYSWKPFSFGARNYSVVFNN